MSWVAISQLVRLTQHGHSLELKTAEREVDAHGDAFATEFGTKPLNKVKSAIQYSLALGVKAVKRDVEKEMVHLRRAIKLDPGSRTSLLTTNFSVTIIA